MVAVLSQSVPRFYCEPFEMGSFLVGMNNSPNSQYPSLAAEHREGDGKDPRFDPAYATSASRIDRKAMQLCRQVSHALEYCVNEHLDADCAVMVVDVAPAPNTSHLLVLLQAIEPLELEQIMSVEKILNQNVGALRMSIAQSIHRKKTPTLTIRVLPRLDKSRVSSTNENYEANQNS